MRDPTTRGEWRDAVDAAHALLMLNSAREYGLVTGGPEVDVDRAQQILRDGKARGITPRTDAVDRLMAELMHADTPPISSGEETGQSGAARRGTGGKS